MLTRQRDLARNVRQKMSGYELLCRLEDGTAALAFFDPQYRGIMEAMAYGNEGARQKARARLPQMSDRMIRLFIEEIARILRPNGYLLFWVDKYMIGTGAHADIIEKIDSMRIVDVICWDGLGFGMGKRTRGAAQYAVMVQKHPTRPRWIDRRMRDVWTEPVDRSLHPHAKPYQLTERIIKAVTKRGDLIVDPCAGGYGVLEACLRTRREFIGCDLETPVNG